MKKKNNLFFAFGLSIVLLGLLVTNADVLAGIKVFMFTQMTPLDLVFDEGIDLTQYDGAVILNCLRDKNFCPEGVHFKDDLTGEIAPNPNPVPKKTVPVVGAPDPTPDMFITGNPSEIEQLLNKVDNTAYIIYGLIIAGIIFGILYFIKKRNKPSIV